jgi:hypothetical protein
MLVMKLNSGVGLLPPNNYKVTIAAFFKLNMEFRLRELPKLAKNAIQCKINKANLHWTFNDLRL